MQNTARAVVALASTNSTTVQDTAAVTTPQKAVIMPKRHLQTGLRGDADRAGLEKMSWELHQQPGQAKACRAISLHAPLNVMQLAWHDCHLLGPDGQCQHLPTSCPAAAQFGPRHKSVEQGAVFVTPNPTALLPSSCSMQTGTR